MQPGQEKSDIQLLAWAAALLAQRQREEVHGTFSVHLEGGRIIRVTTQINELPPVTSPPER